MPVTSGNIMDKAAILLNDKNKIEWTYTVLISYLSLSLDELELEYGNNSMPTLKEVSGVVDVAASATPTVLATPADILVPIEVFERADGSTSESDWVKIQDKEWEDNKVPEATLGQYTWREEAINLPGCTTARELRIRYYKKIADATSVLGTDNLTIGNAVLFLSYRTAALAAEFGGEQKRRAESLNLYADEYLDKAISRDIKSTQGRPRRRKPFGHKRRMLSRMGVR